MMEKKLIFTDLDGTIITSEKREEGIEYICVAEKYGRPTSYMKLSDYLTLRELMKVAEVVPITTRCVESYNNIYIRHMFKRAMVENGAVLITNDVEVDWKWYQESSDIYDKQMKYRLELEDDLNRVGNLCWDSLEFVLDYDTKCKPDIDPEKYPGFLINIGNGYAIATDNNLSKGKSIMRFCKLFGGRSFIACGNGPEDLSMKEVSENFIFIREDETDYDFTTRLLQECMRLCEI